MIIRDGEWELVSHNPHTGKTSWLRDNGDGTKTIREDFPHDATIDANAAIRNETAGNRMGDWVHVASIPAPILWNENTGLMSAINQEDNKFVSRWMNDSDNRAWRTREGRF